MNELRLKFIERERYPLRRISDNRNENTISARGVTCFENTENVYCTSLCLSVVRLFSVVLVILNT